MTPSEESDESEGSDAGEVEVGKSRLKPIDMTSDESLLSLKKKIFEWRRSEATKRFGSGVVAAHGSHLLMTDSTIDRIIACAKAGKLPNVARLVTETKWRKDLAEQYGPTLLSIIHESFADQHMPKKRRKKKSLKVETAIMPEAAVATVPVAARTMRCSACGLTGHNREYPSTLGSAY